MHVLSIKKKFKDAWYKHSSLKDGHANEKEK